LSINAGLTSDKADVASQIIGMRRISDRIIQPFFISGIRSDTGFELPDIRPETGFELPDIRPDTENSRISGRIEKITISIHKFSKKCLSETVTALM
jgi:hypothetical protein